MPVANAAAASGEDPASVSFSAFGVTSLTPKPDAPDEPAAAGAAGVLEVDLCLDLPLDLPAATDAGAALDLNLDGLPAAAPLTIDLPLGDTASGASLITALPASPERRVDLDLPLETVPAILWRSDLGGLDDQVSERTSPAPRARAAPASRAAAPAPEPAASALGSLTAVGALSNGARPRWHGLLDTTLAKAWAQSQLVALLRVASRRLDEVEGALGGAAQSAAHAAHGERLAALLAEAEIAKLAPGARVQATADAHLVIVPGLRSASAAETLARRCIEVLSRPVEVGSLHLSLPAAVGISVFPHDGQQTELLLRAAEVAWRHASEPGRSGYQFYAMEMEARSLRRLTLEAAFREALVHNTLALNFEPQIDVRGGKIAGAVVGLQWTPPEGPALETAAVLALAEEVGLAEMLAHWLVDRASEQIRLGLTKGLRSQRLTLPILPSALRRRYSVQRLHEILYDHGIAPGQLTLLLCANSGDCIAAMDRGGNEKTPRAAARDCALRLQPLADAGFGLAVDASLCSAAALAQLRQLPLTVFHLDVALLDSLDDGEGSLAGVLVQLGQRLRLRVVATGVDAESRLQRLCELGVDAVQGSLLAEPLSAATWLELLLGANVLHAPTTLSLLGAMADGAAAPASREAAEIARVVAWATTQVGDGQSTLVLGADGACDIALFSRAPSLTNE